MESGKKGKLIFVIVLFMSLAVMMVWIEFMFINKGTDMGSAMELEVTPIENCTEGERVKIHGVIEAQRTVVLSGEYYKMNWAGEVRDFSITDDTGEVEVVPRTIWPDDDSFEVYSAPHHKGDKDQFWADDEVWAVGTIEMDGNEKILVLDMISGKEDGFPYPYLELSFGSLFILINMMFLGLFINVAWENRFREGGPREEFWSHDTRSGARTHFSLGIGSIVGAVPVLWFALTWDTWSYVFIMYCIIGFCFFISGFRKSDIAKSGGKFSYSQSIGELGEFKNLNEIVNFFESYISVLEDDLKHNNMIYDRKVARKIKNRPVKYGFDLKDHNIELTVNLFSYKGTRRFEFTIGPVTWFNRDSILPIGKRIINDSLEKFVNVDRHKLKKVTC